MTTLLQLFMTLLMLQAAPQHDEHLIVFLQSEDQYFNTDVLPDLEQYAKENGIKLDIRNTEAGVPREITSTPAIIFYSARGRSVYAGRYSEFSTIENFIRSSRVAPQLSADNCRDSILTREDGRMRIIAPLKITELKGAVGPELNEAAFHQFITTGLEKGLTRFSRQSSSCLERTDRAYYLDIHPFVDEQRILYLSYEVFSQFDCIHPIASSKTQPLQAPWEERTQLLSALAQAFDAIVSESLRAATNGDASTAIPTKIPDRSWATIHTTTASTEPAPREVDYELVGPFPANWTFAGPVAPDYPVIQFQFQAPLDRYAGEVREVTGHLSLSADGRLQSGAFTVKTASLTMGLPSFDEKIHKKYIRIRRFPKASFEFSGLEEVPALQWGQVTRMAIPGTFQLMRYKKPIQIATEIKPILDEGGQPVLLVSAQFQINITDDFHINGPDGPEEAAKMMHFNLNFLMR